VRLFVAGGTGFIGRHLVRDAASQGDHVVVLSRSGTDRWRHPRVRVVAGDAARPREWRAELDGADAVVNLAGALILDPLHRWSERRKRLLIETRVETTRGLVEAIGDADHPPVVLANASAVGYYGSRGDQVLDESAPQGPGFMADLVGAWEATARRAERVCRVVRLRSGVVLGRGGGMLSRLLPIFRLGLGGPWGGGEQWLPWIHLTDEVGIIRFAIERALAGAVNLAAPNPTRVREFAAALGRAVRRPAVLPAPALALRLTLGQAAQVLLTSQRVVPRAALAAGYEFRFPELDRALGAVV
jgi:uncharacterized protein (TIGR01777 family)